MNKEELRKKQLKLEKKKIQNDLKKASNIANFNASIWSEEELNLLLIFNDIPELIVYISNVKNFINPKTYPYNPEEVYKRYLIDRRKGEYLILPEIYLYLFQLGFNIRDEATQKLAMNLTNHIAAERKEPTQILINSLVEAIKTIHPVPSNLLKNVLPKVDIENYPPNKVARLILDFLASKKNISSAQELTLKPNHK